MEGQRLERETVHRDKRIQIGGRYCSLCKVNAPLALTLRFIGELAGEIVICVRCLITASHDLAAHKDVVLTVETLPNGGGGIIHA
jgi:hypothetical protein